MSVMQAACVLALLGLLALCAPAADARQLKQAVTDADVLNFALNLEVTTSVLELPIVSLQWCLY